MGFRLFEIFFNTWGELKPAYLKRIKQILDSGNAGVKSIHPFTSGFESMMFFSDYDSRFRDSLDFYRHYFEAAAYLGAGILVLHGQREYLHGKITEEEYFDRYARLYEAGKQEGILVAQENVNRFRSEDPGFIRRMRRSLSGECCFVFDVKQAVRAGFDPYDMCDAMGEDIVHVHLNDNLPGSDCLLPGTGMMDFRRLKRQLTDYGYSGDLIIEVYRSSFRRPESLLQAKKFVDELTEEF
ncbi:MAG TPA: sugar phosphate isomerase/epimerase [Ruminococcaceae bacterium]|jgi:sugar phosphate isomerase/epimerase|nr:sugar phosphate isomerase/epimerase [Oscillospiraceae bacterium]